MSKELRWCRGFLFFDDDLMSHVFDKNIVDASGYRDSQSHAKRTEKCGVKKLKVVYSEELPVRPIRNVESDNKAEDSNLLDEKKIRRKDTPGSVAFVPSVAGLIIAGEVVKDLCGMCNKKTVYEILNENRKICDML